ncbi:aminotransferase [Dasania sp. GY-MA-18]|uniref:Aminotransferase n=1 Tax=Dasania phycosphaerae TaxID=2950436 RepID=A0A9J6RM62_9GAMM|nr:MULTISPECIES: aminotransferase [Dasania]MCR8923179.1 aminotransferase [Dasania sp. GY-MA-18]MCZ0865611.1 aminotransferase [Dasania phycosphaerae]MCZ0869336.1 aminotransferase [Dasania phycosphaerae]
MSKNRDLFNKHLLHPWGNLPELGEDESISVIVKGEGAYIYDEEGNKLLDGPAGMWCMQTGYGRKEIADAIAKQVMELGYATSFTVTNPVEAELAQRIASQTPGDLNRIFFTTGGSTAVDSALRLCQLANNIKGQPQRKHILTREKAYHGSTFLGASVTGKERDKSAMDVYQDYVHFLSVPCQYHHPDFDSEADFCDFLIQELEDKIAELGPENVMCMIAEPVLGSGGVVVPPADYNRRCCETVQKHGIYYIADEVVTAFGRLGHWFASEKVFNTSPDIITFAKGITSGYVPLGGYAVSDKFMEAISGDNAKGRIYSNGYTWSGAPVPCAAALASWDIIENEKILDNVHEVGPYFQEQLRTLKDIPLVGDVRGIGMMAAVEMTLQGHTGSREDLLAKDYAIGAMVDDYCHQFGLLVRPFINVCIMSPPLILTKAQVDDLVLAMRKALELTLNDLREQGIWVD